MVELPEIETLRHGLDRDIAGKKVKSVEAANMTMLGRYKNRKQFTGELEGSKVGDVQRYGTLIVVALDEERVLGIDLGSEGRLRRTANKEKEIEGTQVVITFTQGGQLRIIDPVGDAQVFVVPEDELFEARPELLELGTDPLKEAMSWTMFAELLRRRKAKLKTLLLDQTFLVGISDVYADEILFNAGVRYDRLSNTLSTQEVRRLYRSLVETLHDAIKYRGTSLEGGTWVDLYGEPGEYQDHLQVYGKEGQLSPRSRGPIKRAKFGGKWTYYCETQV
jgi:formamidopyrimidine-DNA glycosylase